MNGIETALHARVERSSGVEKVVVELHEVQPLQESSGPRERRCPVPTDGAKNLDSGEPYVAVTSRPSCSQASRKDPGVKMDTIVQRLTTSLLGGTGQFTWNRFTGPGRVGLQSMYLHYPTAE